MIAFKTTGSWDRTERFLRRAQEDRIRRILDKYGREGVRALQGATPVDSQETANSWEYEIKKESNGWSIIWSNTHVVDGTPVVILLQYGHATGTGGYVQGRDFINPAMKPIFDRICDEAWKEATSG